MARRTEQEEPRVPKTTVDRTTADPSVPTGPAGAAAAGQALDPQDLIDRPGEQGTLGDQGEGSAIPEHEAPEAGSVEAIGGDAVGIEGPTTDHGDIEQVGGGPASIGDMAELDDLLAGNQGYGGLDGRNDAGDAGHRGSAGEVPDFGAGSGGIGNPHAGILDKSAAGKLPSHQQAVLDQYNQEARDAAAKGDFDAANEAAEKTQNFLAEIGAGPPASGDGGGKPELITNFGSGQAGPKQVWDPEKGEVVIVEEGTETEHEEYVSESAQLKATGTAASSPQDDGSSPPPDEGDLAEDQTPDSGTEAPDLHSDFYDQYQDMKFDAIRGADVDPNPNADYASVTGDPDTDHTDLHAEYGEGYEPVDPDAYEGREIDTVPDEEFMET